MLRALCIVAVLCAGGGRLFCQQVHPVTKRPIDGVMGVAGADWLDREERGKEERPDKALAALHLKPGMQVGDVGAGTGFYSLRIAQAVGPSGKVFANDLQPEMLARVAEGARSRKLENVVEVQGTETDCKLPQAKLDLVILVDVYHEFSHPQEMLRSIRRSLKGDGQIVLLEFRGEDDDVPIRPEHKMTLRQVKAEVAPEGFAFEKSVESLPWQHMIFFRVAGEQQ